MAEYLVLKAEDICDDNNCVKSRLIFYYKHYALFNEDFFRETEPKTAEAPIDICLDFNVFPGIYELIFEGEEEGQPGLVSIKFVKPVDLWETQDIENEPAANHCSCSNE
ncbi:hypothetical protein ACOBQJ_12110 [Pelotomaculum propionicicum]|uniref:hypothetical protein n=1 Tax=Pelotomaculum propionicicum TaxID=258475 RepID=UPI003B792306